MIEFDFLRLVLNLGLDQFIGLFGKGFCALFKFCS